MALYEHIFIARQDISAQQVEGLVDMAQAVLDENGGKNCARFTNFFCVSAREGDKFWRVPLVVADASRSARERCWR